jgi:TonB family protein
VLICGLILIKNQEKFMCCKSYWKKILPFTLALILSFVTVYFFQNVSFLNKNQDITKSSNSAVLENAGSGQSGSEYGIGCGECEGKSSRTSCLACKEGYFPFAENRTVETKKLFTKGIQIISKPRPIYTDAARQNQMTGVVRLRITFLASGEIGAIVPVINLPDGLTEQAMIAAKNIRFKPALVGGKSVTVTKAIDYSFTIY